MLALFGVIKAVEALTTRKADTTEGLAIIKEQESMDVQTIESKIQTMEAKEKADAEAEANRTEKQMFVNSVVMGDSITQGFIDYDVLESANVIAKIGVSIPDLSDAIETATNMNPDAIFLAYGMNDVLSTRGDASIFKDEYKGLIDELKEKLPNSRIFVNAIFPVQQQEIDKEPLYKNLAEYNKTLEELCNEEQITFIDNSSLIVPEYYEEDGVHFKADFYPIWARNMAEVASL